MTDIEKYEAYWNQWHLKWFNSLQDKNAADISEWTIPQDKGGNECLTKEYFPEPYWGNIKSNSLKAIFLNINPGLGGPEQNFINSNNPVVKNHYTKNNCTYSNTVLELSNDKSNRTTKWMYKHRINWLNSFQKDAAFDISNTILCDLIPWHTKSKSGIADYTKKEEHQRLILDQVILPLARIAKTIEGDFANSIIVRSSLLLDILNSSKLVAELISESREFVILKKGNSFSKMNSFLTEVEIIGTRFLIFSGGASMALPNIEYEVVPLGKARPKTQNLKNFILE